MKKMSNEGNISRWSFCGSFGGWLCCKTMTEFQGGSRGWCFVLLVLFGHMIYTRHKGTGARETKKRPALFLFLLSPFLYFHFLGDGWIIGSWSLALVWWRNEEKLDGREEEVEEVNT